MEQPRRFNVREGASVKLFVLGFSARSSNCPSESMPVGFGTPFELSTVASNLASTGEFRDPFGIPSGPTAHVAPVYPFILATVIRVLRSSSLIVWAAILLNACLLGWTAALLPKISRLIYGRSAPGIAGGVLLAVSSRLMPQWEVALAALLMLLSVYCSLKGSRLSRACGAGYAYSRIRFPFRRWRWRRPAAESGSPRSPPFWFRLCARPGWSGTG